MLTILHTADWHLGQKLMGWSRDWEQARVLDRLIGIAVERRVDAVVVAGDVFDSQNPPHEAEKLYYDTLVALRRALPRVTVVVTAGNHDPAGRIDAPGPLVAALGVHTIGTVRRRDGALDLDRHLVALKDAGGDVRAHVLVLPHLGPGALPPLEHDPALGGSPVVRAVTAFHAEVVAAARARVGAAPLIVTGHLTVAGGLASEGAERRILIGGEHAVPASIFPDDVAYVALGHLHKPQQVRRVSGAAGDPARPETPVRYSGSLMPLSATERNYDHGVSIVTIDANGVGGADGAPVAVEHVPLGRPVPFLRVPERGAAALGAIEAEIIRLGLDPDRPIGEQPFVQLAVSIDGPAPGLKADLDRIAAQHPLRLVGHTVERIGAAALEPGLGGADGADDGGAELQARDPAHLFRDAFTALHGFAPDERHEAAFRAAADAALGAEG